MRATTKNNADKNRISILPHIGEVKDYFAKSCNKASCLQLSVIIIALQIVFSQQTYSQTLALRNYGPERSSVSDAPQKDAIAVQILQQSISKLGGIGAWSSVHGVRVSGQIGPDSGQLRFLWLDDWSSGYLRSSKIILRSSDANIYTKDSSAQQTTHSKNQNTRRRQAPLIERLAIEAPAVSMIKALEGHQYAIMRDMRKSTSSMTCILVRGLYPKPQGSTLLKWFIASETGLPDHVEIESPDLSHPRVIVWETATYRQYNSQEGLLVPFVVYLQRDHGMPTRLQFITFQSNPAVSAQDFKGDDQ